MGMAYLIAGESVARAMLIDDTYTSSASVALSFITLRNHALSAL